MTKEFIDTSKLVFKNLETEDIPKLMPFFDLRDNWSCDSTLFDSYLWKDLYQIRYCIVNDEAVFWLMHEEDEEDDEVSTALPYCSPENLQKYMGVLQDYFNNELKTKMNIYLADEEAFKYLNLPEEQYEVFEEKDLADYIYDAGKLRTLSGKDFHKKKNHLNAFLKEYEGRWEYRSLTSADQEEIWTFLNSWEDHKDDDHHLTAEEEGLLKMFPDMEALDAKMGGIYIDGQLKAFSIGTYNKRQKMSVCHVEKADPLIRGLYVAINQQFQLHEYPDALYANREDDMGLPGLRKAKESWHPVKMARKFNICQK